MKYIYLCAICILCFSCLRTSEDIEEQNRNRMRTSSTMESGTMVEGDCRKESDACADGFVCLKQTNGYECVLSDNNVGTQAGTTASDVAGTDAGIQASDMASTQSGTEAGTDVNIFNGLPE